jgi:TorA maturation chaperone TorD
LGTVRLDSASAPVRVGVAATLDSEDVLRAQVYRLLARLLAAPPDQALLDVAADLKGDETALGQGFRRLAAEAARATPAAATEEYFDLFIGIGRGELVPYASYYLTGFLNEKPLARLRGEMAELGIARVAEVKEPEDHIAALCEMMAGLIEGIFGAPAALSAQRRFFERHLAPWAAQFFTDLETAQAAMLYAPVGAVGRAFMAIETTAFAMTD